MEEGELYAEEWRVYSGGRVARVQWWQMKKYVRGHLGVRLDVGRVVRYILLSPSSVGRADAILWGEGWCREYPESDRMAPTVQRHPGQRMSTAVRLEVSITA